MRVNSLQIPAVAATVVLWWILLIGSAWVLIRALRRRRVDTDRVGGWQGRIFLFIAGVVTFVVSQVLGAFVGGPVVRAVFGEPFDFHADYNSPEAILQAIVTQVAAASIAFTVVGIISGKSGRVTTAGSALWACNPLSMCVGAMVVLDIMLRYDVPYEYVGVGQLGFHVVASPGVYAWLLGAGRRIGVGRPA